MDNLDNIVKEGILKPGEVGKAKLPSGNEVTLSYIKDPGYREALEMEEIYRVPVKPVPKNYIEKSVVKPNGNIVKSRHDIVDNATVLKLITEHCPDGKINQLYYNLGAK